MITKNMQSYEAVRWRQNAKTMPISWRRKKDGFIMKHKLKTETFS